MELIERQNSLAQKARSMKHQVGSETFAAQWQQTPVPPSGSMIQRSWVVATINYQFQHHHSRFFWDTASKDGGHTDYSVCTTWLLNEGKYYLKHVLRDRFDYPTLKARAIANAREYRTNRILVEDTGVGTALIPELLQAGFSAIGVKPHHDKKRAWQSNPQNSRVEAFFSRAGRHGLRIWRPSCSVFRLHVMMTGSTASARPWRMKSHMAGTKIT
jgi:phage terminase large subunit-like protein